MRIDFRGLREHVESEFVLGPDSLHGPDHWGRVERIGLELAGRNGADETVVRLFALLHDSRRLDEGYDFEHGRRGAENARALRERFFFIDDDRFRLLFDAIAYHVDGEVSDDLTIGTCWDADRLDLGRVGIEPSPEYLSTRAAKELLMEPGWMFRTVFDQMETGKWSSETRKLTEG